VHRSVRIAIGCLLASLALACSWPDDRPRCVILFIGDGMGPEQARAGRYYLGRELSFESFPSRALSRSVSICRF